MADGDVAAPAKIDGHLRNEVRRLERENAELREKVRKLREHLETYHRKDMEEFHERAAAFFQVLEETALE